MLSVSVQVLFNGTEAAMVLTFVILKWRALETLLGQYGSFGPIARPGVSPLRREIVAIEGTKHEDNENLVRSPSNRL